MISRHQIKINFPLTPNSTSYNTYSILNITLLHLSIDKTPFIDITRVPSVFSFPVEFIIFKLSVVLITWCKNHSSITLSATLHKIPFINVAIWPHHFPYSMKFSINEISTVFLIISSSQCTFSILHVIGPRPFVNCVHRFWINNDSVYFLSIFIPSSID